MKKLISILLITTSILQASTASIVTNNNLEGSYEYVKTIYSDDKVKKYTSAKDYKLFYIGTNGWSSDVQNDSKRDIKKTSIQIYKGKIAFVALKTPLFTIYERKGKCLTLLQITYDMHTVCKK
jgi:hypothetical protein